MIPGIYIDNARIPWTPPHSRFSRPWLMSHLFSPNVEALHDFAQSIGIQRKWYQGPKAGWPHYDITEKIRKKAVAAGALEIEYRELPQWLEKLGIARDKKWMVP